MIAIVHLKKTHFGRAYRLTSLPSILKQIYSENKAGAKYHCSIAKNDFYKHGLEVFFYPLFCQTGSNASPTTINFIQQVMVSIAKRNILVNSSV